MLSRPYSCRICMIMPHSLSYNRNNARFLWKRIPGSVKQNFAEVSAVWKIGQCLWTYNYAGVHDALQSYTWSPYVQRIVTAFGG